MTSLQEERERAREELRESREIYEKHIEEINNELESSKKSLTGMNELYIEQQKRVQKMLDEMAEKDAQAEGRVQAKQEELKKTRQAQQLAEDKLKFAEAKYVRETEEARKRYQKEIDDWRFKSEQIATRNAELSRANGELRRRLQTLEAELKEISEKVIFQILG